MSTNAFFLHDVLLSQMIYTYSPVQELVSKVEDVKMDNLNLRLHGLCSCVLIMYFANAIFKDLGRCCFDEASIIVSSA